MNITSAKYNESGTINAVINGVNRSGITEESRFYPAVQDWVAEGG